MEEINWLFRNSTKINDTYYFYSEVANITYTYAYNKLHGTIQTRNQQINYAFFSEDLLQKKGLDSRVTFTDKYECWFGKGTDFVFYLRIIKWLLETNRKTIEDCYSSPFDFLGWLPQFEDEKQKCSFRKSTYLFPYPWMERLEIEAIPLKDSNWKLSAKAYKWSKVFTSLTINFTMKDICFKIRCIVYDWLEGVEKDATKNFVGISVE